MFQAVSHYGIGLFATWTEAENEILRPGLYCAFKGNAASGGLANEGIDLILPFWSCIDDDLSSGSQPNPVIL